jgi:hypothetical protein
MSPWPADLAYVRLDFNGDQVQQATAASLVTLGAG